ncbi:MAG: SGNH/GDSL hydrolase family protein, partial [Gemmatimonadales bacterium]
LNPRRYFDIDLRDPATRERYRGMGVSRVDRMLPRTPFAVERRYNSLHFRGPEIPPRRPGVARVAVIGDSFTEGMGVKEEDAYPRVLDRLLEGEAIEVLNCGRRGYDFPALYDLFEEVLGLDPDLVVYGMVLNDADRSAALDARDQSLNDWIRDRGPMASDVPLPELGFFVLRTFEFVRDRIRAYRLGRDTSRWYLDLYGEANREGWARTEGFVREMNRRLGERGKRFLVALWPLLVDLDEYPFAAIDTEISRLCLTAGIPQQPLRPAFRGRRTETLWVDPADHHPNEVAHRLAAEQLLPSVRSLARPGP